MIPLSFFIRFLLPSGGEAHQIVDDAMTLAATRCDGVGHLGRYGGDHLPRQQSDGLQLSQAFGQYLGGDGVEAALELAKALGSLCPQHSDDVRRPLGKKDLEQAVDRTVSLFAAFSHLVTKRKLL